MRKCVHPFQIFITSETTVELCRKQKTHTRMVQRICNFVPLLQFYFTKIYTICQTSQSITNVRRSDYTTSSATHCKMPVLKSQIRMGNCPICKVTSRTACAACKQPYYYDCGREHIMQPLMQNVQD